MQQFHTLRRATPAIVLLTLAGSAVAANAEIPWKSGQAAPALAADLPVAQTAADLIAAGRRAVIDFGQPVTQAQREELAAAGVTLLSPLGRTAYFASFTPTASLDQAIARGSVASVAAVRPEWKLHPALAVRDLDQMTRVDADATDPMIAAYIMLHRDADLAEGDQLVKNVGGRVVDSLTTINALVIEVKLSAIDALAGEDAVQWLEPALPRMSETNASNRVVTQVDQVHAAPYGLDGTGVTALIYDGGRIRTTHLDFNGRATVLPIDTDGLSTHATHVAGTVGGSGAFNPTHKGMAPNVTILSAGFEFDSTGTFLYTNPGDIEQDYGQAISMFDVDITNNSIGTNTESNGFSCAFQGQYGLTSSVIDSIARGSLGKRITIVWANGNERQGSRCDIEGFGDYYSVAPPAGAKNHLAIGALNSDTDGMTSFSAWGPTDDGRMKPDFSGPGCQSGSDGGVTSLSSSGDTNYTTLCGTSMSSPTVAGITALLLQDFRDNFPGLDDPWASTMKTFLAHTAVDRGNVGPDYQFGYGSVLCEDAVDFIRTAQFFQGSIGQGAVQTIDIEVSPGDDEIKVTMAWDDPPATPNVIPSLVNDLDVRLIDPAGGVHFPWVLNPADPGAPATQDGPNTLDNLEQVLVNNPMPGTWRVEVVGTGVAEGPQDYSIVGSPNLDVAFVSLAVASETPDLVPPGESLAVEAQLTAINTDVQTDSVTLNYRLSGSEFIAIPMTETMSGMYTADVPAANCGQSPAFYVTALTADGELILNPAGGPNDPITYNIGEVFLDFQDQGETDDGWSVIGNATDGQWNRGVPVGGGDRGDPASDSDGSGSCWLTDNEDGNSDVDGGDTVLISPILDGTGVGTVLSYDRWYSNNFGGAPEGDVFIVQISNDGGTTWEVLEQVGPTGDVAGGWNTASFTLADVTTPTDQIRLRFIASDFGDGSVIEAGIDNLRITRVACESDTCAADYNGDGEADFFDVQAFLSDFESQLPSADFTNDGVFDFFDVQAFLNIFGAGCP